MPIKGLSEVKRNIKKEITDIATKKAERAVTIALIIGMGNASTLTPVDTGTLINSQFRKINRKTGMVSGEAGYTAAYALAVHNASGKLKGKPRADFGTTRDGVSFGGGTGVGKYWDPGAEPKFLKKGFEEERAAIDAAVYKEMKV